MDYLSFCPSLNVNKGFQLGKKMSVFFLLIFVIGVNRDQFCKRCLVSRLLGKVQNIDLMSSGLCFNFLFVCKGCSFKCSLETMSENNLSIRLDKDKLKTYQQDLDK